MTTRLSHIIAVCLISIFVVSFSSCEQKRIYDKFRSVSVEGWERGDTVVFPVDSVQKAGIYRIDIGLRTTSAYRFQKLWLVVEQIYTHPNRSELDTLSCALATPDGTITGHGVSLYVYNFPLTTVSLGQGQRGQIVVRHIMRSDMLLGVSDVGVRIERDN